MAIIELKSAPEVLHAIRAASPSYRRHKAILVVSDRVTIAGTYWSGGSRSTYTAVDLRTGRVQAAPQYSPPQFGGPQSDPTVTLPDGVAIIATGTFCGKTATATVYINANTAALLLEGAAS